MPGWRNEREASFHRTSCSSDGKIVFERPLLVRAQVIEAYTDGRIRRQALRLDGLMTHIAKSIRTFVKALQGRLHFMEQTLEPLVPGSGCDGLFEPSTPDDESISNRVVLIRIHGGSPLFGAYITPPLSRSNDEMDSPVAFGIDRGFGSARRLAGGGSAPADIV